MNIAQPELIFNSLELALDYLDRHMYTRYLFPIRAGAKFPPLLKDNLDGNCSNDPKQIIAWSKKFSNCNWGVAARKSGIMPVDVDTNKAKGKIGDQTYLDLELTNGWPATETTTSPSGGKHHIYQGWTDDDHPAHIMALGENGIGKDIDCPNYVLIPGCQLADGSSYTTDGADAVLCPQWIYDTIKSSKTKSRITDAGEIVVELDQPANITWAIDYLQNDAAPAIAGDGGEFITYKVAATLKDNGISPTLTLDLMLEYYNPRCAPEWERDDLEKKIENAFAYANLSKTGGRTAESDFANEPPEPPIKPQGIWNVKTGKLDPPNTAKVKKDAADRAKVRADEAAKPDSEKEYRPTRNEVSNGWVYITGADVFVAKEMPPMAPNGYHPPRQMLKAVSFDRAFMYLTPKKGGKLSDDLLRMKKGGIARASQLVYRPDVSSKFFRMGKESFLNLYIPSPIVSAFDPDNPEAVAALEMWDAHLRYLFPDQESRDLVLNWFAWLIQNMEKKPRFALLVHGPLHGTGKSFLGKMLKSIIGSYNTSRITAKMLGSQFNQYAQNAKLIIVEELRALDRADVKETLHDMISEDEISINSKMEKLLSMLNCFGIFAMTNIDAALKLDNGDRRYMIIRCDAVPKPEAYYEKLHKLLRSEVAIAAIGYALANRELGEYSGEGRAPMTSAKAAMVRAGGGPLEQWMEDNAGKWPLKSRLVAVEDIVDALPRRFRNNQYVGQNITAELKAAFAGVPVRIPVNGEKLRLWAIGAEPELMAALRDRDEAIKSRDTDKVHSRNAWLAGIYEGDKVKAGKGQPVGDFDDDDGD
jgi:hypothetical protein